MCDTPIARVTGCVSSLKIYVGDSPCNYSVAIRVMFISLCAETINPLLRGTKSDSCARKCISLSSESCKSNNRGGEGGAFKDMGGRD